MESALLLREEPRNKQANLQDNGLANSARRAKQASPRSSKTSHDVQSGLHSPPQRALGDTADVKVVQLGEDQDHLRKEDIQRLQDISEATVLWFQRSDYNFGTMLLLGSFSRSTDWLGIPFSSWESQLECDVRWGSSIHF